MKSTNLTKKIGGSILGLVMLVGIGLMSSATAQAQWQQWPSNGRNRDDRYGRGGNNRGFQVARDRLLQRVDRSCQSRYAAVFSSSCSP